MFAFSWGLSVPEQRVSVCRRPVFLTAGQAEGEGGSPSRRPQERVLSARGCAAPAPTPPQHPCTRLAGALPCSPRGPGMEGEAEDLGQKSPCPLDGLCFYSLPPSGVRIYTGRLGFRELPSPDPDLHPCPSPMGMDAKSVAVPCPTWGRWREQSLASQDPCKRAVELIYAPDISLPVGQSF